MTQTDDQNAEPNHASVHGIAALTLLEAIILVLQSKGALSSDEVDEAYDAAISAHLHHHEAHSAIHNELAAAILTRLRVEGNSVRLDL
jgi:hypothetical protein